MWEKLLQIVKSFFTFAKELEQSRADIKKLREDVETLTRIVERQHYQIEINRQNESKEREILALKVENEILKSQKQLPRPALPRAKASLKRKSQEKSK